MVEMRHRSAISNDLWQEALDYCRASEDCDGERTCISIRVLESLRKNDRRTAKEIGLGSGCGRKHVLKIIGWVKAGEFHELVGNSFGMRPLLDEPHANELKQKLGTDLFSAQDVLDWYKFWSGKSAPESTVYSWCQTAGFPLRNLPKTSKTRQIRRPRKGLKLSQRAENDLRARQAVLVAGKGTLEDVLKSKTRQNPVKRIEAVLLYATTSMTYHQISKKLNVDAARWVRCYCKEGLEALCEVEKRRVAVRLAELLSELGKTYGRLKDQIGARSAAKAFKLLLE